jgi:hypothetical protein
MANADLFYGRCGRSSVGRASASQAEGRRFESGRPLRRKTERRKGLGPCGALVSSPCCSVVSITVTNELGGGAAIRGVLLASAASRLMMSFFFHPMMA